MTIKDNIYPSEVDAAVIVNDQLYLFWVLFLKVDLVKSDKKYLYQGNLVYISHLEWESGNLKITPWNFDNVVKVFPNLIGYEYLEVCKYKFKKLIISFKFLKAAMNYDSKLYFFKKQSYKFEYN